MAMLQEQLIEYMNNKEEIHTVKDGEIISVIVESVGRTEVVVNKIDEGKIDRTGIERKFNDCYYTTEEAERENSILLFETWFRDEGGETDCVRRNITSEQMRDWILDNHLQVEMLLRGKMQCR